MAAIPAKHASQRESDGFPLADLSSRFGTVLRLCPRASMLSNIMPRTALLLWTEMGILKADKMRPLFLDVSGLTSEEISNK